MSGSRPRSRHRLPSSLARSAAASPPRDGRLNSALVHMGCAPGDMLVSGRLDAGQGALERELRVWQGHAGDLEPGWRSATGRGLVAGRGSAAPDPATREPAGDPGARDAKPGAAVQRHQLAPWPGGHGSSCAGFPRLTHGPSRQANGVWPGMAIREPAVRHSNRNGPGRGSQGVQGHFPGDLLAGVGGHAAHDRQQRAPGHVRADIEEMDVLLEVEVAGEPCEVVL